MKLNIENVKLFHHWRYANNRVMLKYIMNSTVLEEVTEIKDLGVYYDPILLFDKHICKKGLHDVGYN